MSCWFESIRGVRVFAVYFALAAIVLTGTRASAAEAGTVTGIVTDQLGGAVSGATVVLTRDGQKVTDARTDGDGHFAVAVVEAGRYGLQVEAPGFVMGHVDPF